MPAWQDCKLGEVVNLKRGSDLPKTGREQELGQLFRSVRECIESEASVRKVTLLER